MLDAWSAGVRPSSRPARGASQAALSRLETGGTASARLDAAGRFLAALGMTSRPDDPGPAPPGRERQADAVHSVMNGFIARRLERWRGSLCSRPRSAIPCRAAGSTSSRFASWIGRCSSRRRSRTSRTWEGSSGASPSTSRWRGRWRAASAGSPHEDRRAGRGPRLGVGRRASGGQPRGRDAGLPGAHRRCRGVAVGPETALPRGAGRSGPAIPRRRSGAWLRPTMLGARRRPPAVSRLCRAPPRDWSAVG